ncbi:MAG TPA: hypothetical protein EYH07_08300 [Kiloniellaceae bacterium]|nr:hypothetical protein [Kiloniellaceae bacterium]
MEIRPVLDIIDRVNHRPGRLELSLSGTLRRFNMVNRSFMVLDAGWIMREHGRLKARAQGQKRARRLSPKKQRLQRRDADMGRSPS